MITKYPETVSTAELASAANRELTNGEEVRQAETQPSPKAAPENAGPLLPENFTQECRTRWDTIQAGFRG